MMKGGNGDKGEYECLNSGFAYSESEEFCTPDLLPALFRAFNSRPFLAAGLGVAFGILVCCFAFFNDLILFLVISVFVIAFLCLGYGFIKSRRGKVALALFGIFFVLGAARAGISLALFANCPIIKSGTPLHARVCEVNEYEDFTVITLENLNFDGEKTRGKACVFVFSSISLPSRYDEVLVSADFTRAIDYYGKAGGPSAKNGVYYTAVLNNDNYIKVTGSSLNVFEKSRKYVGEFLKYSISPENYGVVLAMITGDTSHVGEDVLNSFRLSGLAHVFAVSGLHIGLFSSLFLLLAKLLKLTRIKKCVFVLLPTLFYVGVCGFSSSSVRAFVMLASAMFCESFGLKKDSLSFLSIAALLLCAINPFCIFGAGWLLSFSAVCGIILLAPPLKRGSTVLGKRLGEAVSVSFAAQLGTLPVLTDMCGYISIISTFANLLLLPFLSLVYQILAVASLLGIPFYALGASVGVTSVIMFLPDNALSAITALLTAIDLEKFAVPFIFGFSAVFYYAALIVFSDAANVSIKRKIALCSAFLIAFFKCAF